MKDILKLYKEHIRYDKRGRERVYRTIIFWAMPLLIVLSMIAETRTIIITYGFCLFYLLVDQLFSMIPDGFDFKNKACR